MLPSFLLLWYIRTISANVYTIRNISTKENTLNLENFSLAKESILTLNGITNISSKENTEFRISSNLDISKESLSNCSVPDDLVSLTQTQLIKRLTAPCRYDRLERPSVLLDDGTLSAVDVHVRTFIYVMQSLDSSSLQLKMHGLLQLRFVDPRLAFGKHAPSRQQPILGENQLRELIWVPHIFFSNEHDSSALGTNEKDILTSISADGTVVISARIKATLYCWMNLRKFPFDEQYCSTQLKSWSYNSSEIVLHWEQESPTNFAPNLQSKEFSLINAWYNESALSGDDGDGGDVRLEIFTGNYSTLYFTVQLKRRSGAYILDYFVPSIIIVAISWVSFWLEAGETSPRITLATTTILSFITLSLAQDNNLPNVSYIKISEIWFLSCILFIFGSLIEFAFVNSIWRRKRNVEMKKVSSKHILKSTVVPRDKTNRILINALEINSENYGSAEDNEIQTKRTWAAMTPQEVSLFIDQKARFVFPLGFLIFNIIFWILVYCL